MPAKILVMSGSLRPGSNNTKLAVLAAKEFRALDATVTFLDLGEHALPIYDARIQEQGMPAPAIALYDLFCAHTGMFIASPEYNAFPTPLLLNAIDWVSRVKHEEGGTVEAFGKAAFAIGAAAEGVWGGYRGAMALRHKLELGLAAHVLPRMICVPRASHAFDAEGDFLDTKNNDLLAKVAFELVQAAHPPFSCQTALKIDPISAPNIAP